jgi:actin-related protein
MVDSSQIVVLDLGSDMIRAGFAGEVAPRVIVPSLIGYPKES